MLWDQAVSLKLAGISFQAVCFELLKLVPLLQRETSEKWDPSYLNILSPHTGTLSDFLFKYHSLSLSTFLTKWTDLTKGNLEYQSMATTFLKTELDYHNSKVSRTEWNVCFD